MTCPITYLHMPLLHIPAATMPLLHYLVSSHISCCLARNCVPVTAISVPFPFYMLDVVPSMEANAVGFSAGAGHARFCAALHHCAAGTYKLTTATGVRMPHAFNCCAVYGRVCAFCAGFGDAVRRGTAAVCFCWFRLFPRPYARLAPFYSGPCYILHIMPSNGLSCYA